MYICIEYEPQRVAALPTRHLCACQGGYIIQAHMVRHAICVLVVVTLITQAGMCYVRVDLHHTILR